ncbi:MAG TPA: CAP domain-containing protein [Jatrophihabitans sp.]|nr:CAP domain-containing protein [Jatrophihabitans sp.]
MATIGATAALIGAGAITGTPPAQAATAPESAAANAVLKLMNTERSAHGLPALQMSTALISSARRHNLAMARANTMSHQLPGEPSFGTRISQAGVAWHAAAENIGWTTNRSTSGATGLQVSMYNETAPNDGHRLNILSRSVRYVGVDILIDTATGKLWLTQDFADVGGPQPSSAALVALHNPIGHLDGVSVLSGHRVRLVGWSIDPDYKSVAPLTAVYYDGHYAGYHRSNTPRPDVAARYHAGPDLGFDFTVTLPPGRHTISVYIINIRQGNANPRLATFVRTV